MFKRFLTVPVMSTVLFISACGSTEPMSKSHSLVTPDQSHWAVQISMYSGIRNTPIQTVMVVYNKFNKTPIATVSGQTKPLSEKLADDLLNLISSIGPAAITGRYILEAAESECPPTALCGTLVQVSNSAGAAADSSSAANQQGQMTPGS